MNFTLDQELGLYVSNIVNSRLDMFSLLMSHNILTFEVIFKDGLIQVWQSERLLCFFNLSTRKISIHHIDYFDVELK